MYVIIKYASDNILANLTRQADVLFPAEQVGLSGGPSSTGLMFRQGEEGVIGDGGLGGTSCAAIDPVTNMVKGTYSSRVLEHINSPSDSDSFKQGRPLRGSG